MLSLVIWLIVNTDTAHANDWIAMESEEDCLLMTTEKKKGNLDYPSTLFLSFDKTNNTSGAAVQNFEWGLDPRKTQVKIRVDSGAMKTLDAYLHLDL